MKLADPNGRIRESHFSHRELKKKKRGPETWNPRKKKCGFDYSSTECVRGGKQKVQHLRMTVSKKLELWPKRCAPSVCLCFRFRLCSFSCRRRRRRRRRWIFASSSFIFSRVVGESAGCGGLVPDSSPRRPRSFPPWESYLTSGLVPASESSTSCTHPVQPHRRRSKPSRTQSTLRFRSKKKTNHIK